MIFFKFSNTRQYGKASILHVFRSSQGLIPSVLSHCASLSSAFHFFLCNFFILEVAKRHTLHTRESAVERMDGSLPNVDIDAHYSLGNPVVSLRAPFFLFEMFHIMAHLKVTFLTSLWVCPP